MIFFKDEDFQIDSNFKVNPLYALVNIVPLMILIVSFTGLFPALKMGVAQAMLIDVFLLAALSGAIGRTMSPLVGAVIVCAGIVKVAPLNMAKRTALGMIID